MAQTIGLVSMKNIIDNDGNYTMLIATGAAEALISDIGLKAMSIRAGVDATAKLATDGEAILGRLFSYEARVSEGVTVGAVATEGCLTFMVNPNVTTSSPDQRPAVGDYIVGDVTTAGLAGYVRKATTAEMALGDRCNWLVVEAPSDHLTVTAMKV